MAETAGEENFYATDDVFKKVAATCIFKFLMTLSFFTGWDKVIQNQIPPPSPFQSSSHQPPHKHHASSFVYVLKSLLFSLFCPNSFFLLFSFPPFFSTPHYRCKIKKRIPCLPHRPLLPSNPPNPGSPPPGNLHKQIQKRKKPQFFVVVLLTHDLCPNFVKHQNN